MSGEYLTRKMIIDAIEKIRNEPYRVCPPNDQHVVHPLDAERGGLVPCGNCGGIVDLGKR